MNGDLPRPALTCFFDEMNGNKRGKFEIFYSLAVSPLGRQLKVSYLVVLLLFFCRALMYHFFPSQ